MPIATPAAVTSTPPTARPRRDSRPSDSRTSLIAAMGAVHAARIAGTTAANIVMPIPTSADANTVRPMTTRFASGTGKPNPGSAHNRICASATPSSSPTADAKTPTTAASASTEPITWVPLAPIARRSPSSRVRCETRIVNVLKMMKPPTSRPTPAKPSSASFSVPSRSSTGLPVSVATAAADETSKPPPNRVPPGLSARSSTRFSAAAEVPGATRTLIAS